MICHLITLSARISMTGHSLLRLTRLGGEGQSGRNLCQRYDLNFFMDNIFLGPRVHNPSAVEREIGERDMQRFGHRRGITVLEFNSVAPATVDQQQIQLRAGVRTPEVCIRAMRLGDFDAVYASVQRLTRLNDPAVIPVLIEIVETPRTGFERGEGGMVEANTNRSREAALISLIQWHTPEAQAAVRARQRDREAHIAQGAARALELYPGEWK